MSAERFYVEVCFFDDVDQRFDDIWSSTDRTYGTRKAAERAAERVEIRNGANGVGCKTRVLSYSVAA